MLRYAQHGVFLETGFTLQNPKWESQYGGQVGVFFHWDVLSKPYSGTTRKILLVGPSLLSVSK